MINRNMVRMNLISEIDLFTKYGVYFAEICNTFILIFLEIRSVGIYIFRQIICRAMLR